VSVLGKFPSNNGPKLCREIPLNLCSEHLNLMLRKIFFLFFHLAAGNDPLCDHFTWSEFLYLSILIAKLMFIMSAYTVHALQNSTLSAYSLHECLTFGKLSDDKKVQLPSMPSKLLLKCNLKPLLVTLVVLVDILTSGPYVMK
jgi:hypothetical protein